MNVLKKVILLFIAAVIFASCSSSGEKYVAVYDGENISYAEYLVYLYEQQKAFESTGGVDIWDTKFDGEAAFDVAKKNALDSMIFVLTVIKEKGEGYVVGDEDREYAIDYANDYYSALSESVKEIITYEAVEKVMLDNIFFEVIFNAESINVEFDESEYEAYYAEAVEVLKENGIDIEANSDVIDEVLKQQYLTDLQADVFSAEIEEKIASKKITRNSDVWDSIKYIE